MVVSAHPMLRRLAAAASASGAAVPAVDDAPDPRARRATIDMTASHRIRTPRLLLVPTAEASTGRFTHPQEFADLVLLLASGCAANVTMPTSSSMQAW